MGKQCERFRRRYKNVSDIVKPSLSSTVSAVCLFPPEFEGEYIIQNAAISGGNDVQYSSINITADWIFPYGQCYSRNDSNVIVDLRFVNN